MQKNEKEILDSIKGGLADGLTVEDIANKHGVSKEDIEKQITMGIEVEKEHTDRSDSMNIVAKEIAMDHLTEHPKYYDFLKKMESDMEKDYELKKYGKKKEVKKSSDKKDSEEEAEKRKNSTIWQADLGYN